MDPVIQPVSTLDQRGTSQTTARRMLLGAVVLVLVMMWIPYSQFVLYPVRLFVTLVHESGHALAATLTGSAVEGIRLNPNASGVTLIRATWWADWIINPAGYLGAALFGAMLLQLGRLRAKTAGKSILRFMAGYALVVTLVWCHNPAVSGLFTPVMGVLIAVIMGLLARYLPDRAAQFVAIFIAVECGLDALNDLVTLLVITTNHLGDNDAANMAAVSHIPAIVWALLWAALASILVFGSFRIYWRAVTRPKSAL